MSKVRLNPLVDDLRGQVGEVVFRRYGNKLVISRKPDMSKVKPSAAQVARRERFRAATQYSKQAMAQPENKALYAAEAARRNKPLNSVMVADFLNPPTVERVDAGAYRGRPGDEIVVEADDDFGVVAVTVEIFDEAGALLESGPALENPAGSGRWVYTATTSVAGAVQVKTTAIDRPGHAGSTTVAVGAA